ncbi:MAG: tripartite tricarboxylate transporter substrate binding protein, partial [Eubacteriales bacterium]|nr:tripartite tricarboxylate transporter substrate binding protein [Eubacteriales bacterium]
GQTIVIENVDGGSGSLGWSQLAAADPDGMTIGFMNLPNFNSSIVKGLGTYTIEDFAAICNHVTETSLVVVRADEDRFTDIDGLVEYAKANNTVASTNGAQASNHIGAQAFANSAGFKYTDLPQGNTADELLSLLGGEADWCVAKVADIADRTDVKPLAAFSTEPLPEYPDVPTLASKGYYDQWLGSSRCIVAPAGVTAEMIAFYEAAFKATMEDPDYLAAAASFATDYKDAATTAALIEQQQAFTEGLSTGFWYE